MNKQQSAPEIRFGLSEWAGALGDLGTTLPLAFALVVFNGYSPARILFLWGVLYVAMGLIYRVPVSVQPLKAMAVIAISAGFSPEMLSTAAFLYGVLFLILSLTGIIRRIEKWFSPALVRGVQLGIGLILARKALELVMRNGLYLSWPGNNLLLNLAIVAMVMLTLWLFQFRRKFPAVLILVLGGVAGSLLAGISLNYAAPEASPAAFTLPQWAFFADALLLLIIPQIPLTLGNAVFAASDSCHSFWKEQASRVTPSRLAASIGGGNIFIGLLGGFPICHGAGGIGAHAQFGGRTGGTVIIIGTVFMLVSLTDSLAEFLFLIPVPILAAMLLWDSWRMMSLIATLRQRPEWLISLLVGIISFLTRNLTIALGAGLAAELLLRYYRKKKQAESQD